MDLRTWQEAGSRVGPYSARHRGRSPFSPLRPAPIAIGSLSTAAIAAFAFVTPGILHGPSAGTGSTVLDGAPYRLAPIAAGNGEAAPGFVNVTAPPSPSSDAAGSPASPVAPSSMATSPAVTARSTAAPAAAHTPTSSAPTSQPSQPTLTPTQQPPPSTPTPTQQPPTAPPTTPGVPLPPTTTAPTTKTSFNSAAAVSSALSEISSARSHQGVNLLNVDSLLTKAAKTHAQDMARTGDFSHIGSDGSDPFSRAANLGCFTLSQELIAHGKPGDDVIGALMQDPASRRALLSFWNSTIGVSAQLDPATGDVYWTIELGWM